VFAQVVGRAILPLWTYPSTLCSPDRKATMTANSDSVRELLDGVLASGAVPDDREIRSAIAKYGSVAELNDQHRRLRQACKSVANALDAGLADQARRYADDVVESFGGPSARELAADVPRMSQRAYNAERRPAANRENVQELHSLLVSRVKGRVTPEDLDYLHTRPDASEAELKGWRKAVLAASGAVGERWASGNQAEARRLAREHAEELAGMLAAPEHRDPLEHETDPRVLAAAVPRRR
jgi:hypothetical protein